MPTAKRPYSLNRRAPTYPPMSTTVTQRCPTELDYLLRRPAHLLVAVGLPVFHVDHALKSQPLTLLWSTPRTIVKLVA